MEKYSSRISQQDELDMREIIWIIKRHAIAITTITILSVVGGILYILLKQPVYSSSTTLLIERPMENWWENLAPGSEGKKGKSEIYIIKSRTIAEHVVRELHLQTRLLVPGRSFTIKIMKLPESIKNIGELNFRIINGNGDYKIWTPGRKWYFHGKLNLPVTSPTGNVWIVGNNFHKGDRGKLYIYSFRTAVKKLMDATQAAYVEEKTKVIKITVEDPDPTMAAKISNKVAENYIKWKVEARTEEATKSLNFINKQLNVIMSQLENLENSYDKFKTEKKILSIDDELQAYISQLSDLESTLYQIRFERNAYSEILHDIKKGEKPYLYFAVSEDPVLGNLVSKALDLRTQLSTLSEEYTEDSPQISAVKAQINQIHREIINYLASKTADLSIKEKQLSITIQNLLEKLKKFPESEREILRMKRKLSVTEDIFKFLLKKKEESRITKAMTVSKIRIIDPAIPSTVPEAPRKKLILFLSLIFGLLLAFLLVIAYDYINDTIKDIDELKHIINLPIFGIIPKIYPSDKSGTSKFDPYLIVHYNPRSQVAEAYRMLRTNIQFIDPTGNTKTFLITSALPQEGKSITNSNLAITLSKLGSKTLILDMDFHRPRQHEIFHKPPSPGLTDYLTSQGKLSLDEIIFKLEFDNLYLIPAGTIPPNPSELISSNPFRKFLNDIREKFDFVLIDSPPVTAVTDTLILSTIVDAVLLVVVEGSSRRESIKRAIELLENVGGKLKGSIFNNVSPTERAYGYYYSSGYYHEEIQPTIIDRIRKWIKDTFKRRKK